ncbi:hypothetical protein LPJ64_001965 [Coemansia asiatica]|uniref:CRA domain-containing protein n=1 Tax=Coemansia asiatica TaxID=1052880 RepID=A0A9W8CJH8_9FUNG|nr:hypothetical protein LPJ64_001965 [Coemansia asiatica]
MSNTANKDPHCAAPSDPVDASKLHLLVYSFLLQNNYGRTAQAFARTSGLATSGHLSSESTPEYLSLPFTNNNVVDNTLQLSANGCAGKGKADGSGLLAGSGSGRSSGSGRKDSGVVGGNCNDGKDIGDERAACIELVDRHIEYLRIRQSICSSIEDGEPKVALDLLTTYFRTVLIPPPSEQLPTSTLPTRAEFHATLLRFRLDTQYYVELIASHQELEALKFGQRTLWRYPDIFDMWLNHLSIVHPSSSLVPREEIKVKRVEIMQHITNVAALVAYPDPKKSTLAYLLEQGRRDELAKAVNGAILNSMGFPDEPALVTLVRQLATTSAYLVGYRSSSSSSGAARSGNTDAVGSSNSGTSRNIDLSGTGFTSSISRQQQQQQQQPWVLDAFVNSESTSEPFV